MKKAFLILFMFFTIPAVFYGQDFRGYNLFIIDSVPVYNDPEPWNPIEYEDIAETFTIRNRDSLNQIGWPNMTSVTFIFTREYKNRPDSLKRIPVMKRMQQMDRVWYLNDQPYTGRYIDYFNSGRIMTEGQMLNGKLDGKMIIYYFTGGVKSIINYTEGVMDGERKDYYKNGSLVQVIKYDMGKLERDSRIFFNNGKLQHELRFIKETRNDTSIFYYSTGIVKQMSFTSSGSFTQTDRENKLAYYHNRFNMSLRSGNIREANKNFYKLWQIDSGSADTHFLEGMLFMAEKRFKESIGAFTRALEVEPMMKEALLQRAISVLLMYRALREKAAPKGTVVNLTLQDILQMPVNEQKKIVSDIRLADELDPTDYFVSSRIPMSLLQYCRKAKF